ncbi:MAG: guanylyltransferase [Bacteroidetes bacterium]|nr:guanylyltransferase [Bacteroidota bacterium]
MKFDDLDQRMRIFETASDYSVLPGVYMVARIDGRSFTRLTKEVHKFEAPFDIRFRDMMVETVKHLMNCGFTVIYGYTESDEISLLFSQHENAFSRKLRKYNSVLAGEASAKFSLLINDVATFDCRISQLPSRKDVVDYFQWRNQDALRNSLNAYCYWKLRENGKTARQATKIMLGMTVSDKNELLFQYGINFNEVPAWQKRGIGFYWQEYEKKGLNPKTGEKTVAVRRKIFVDEELPVRESYGFLIEKILESDALKVSM